MRLVKKAIFWLHLGAGLLAGLVVLILGVTGVIMSFERQILEANHGVTVSQPTGQASIAGPEKILAAHADAMPAASGVTYYSDPEMPASVQFGRGKSTYADPYTGESLGEGNTALKGFFGWALRLHRWLTLEGAAREVGGEVVKIGNMVFLFLVVSGLYLWFPKRWTRSGLLAITTLKFRLKGRARDWNWHNAFGFWACIPLLFIVLTGVVMSYAWANNLIYKAVGEAPPPPRQAGGRPASPAMGAEGRPRQAGERSGPRADGGQRPERQMVREGGERGAERPARDSGGRQGGGREREEHSHVHGPVTLAGLDAGLAMVKAASPGWRTIVVATPKGTTAQYTVSASHRGRPDLRRTLTVDLATGQVVKNEGFESQTTGRKARTFARWIHTGEAFGWPGQAVMGLASLAAVVLVWTGFALSWRRFFKKRRLTVSMPAALKEAA